MTRKEHLQFCSKCTRRKFNEQVGLICSITDQKADFDPVCDHFIRDENVVDKEPIEEEEPLLVSTTSEQIGSLPEEIKSALRAHQSMGFAILGGFLLVIFSAILWAALTVATQYQIGYMAIGVGLIVGYGIRYFGAGIDKEYGILGGIFALLGCLLGNLLSTVGFVAQDEGLAYLEVLGFINTSNILEVLFGSFSPMDLLFYGIAIYEGYRFSFRTLPKEMGKAELLEPAGAKFRMPLALLSAMIIGFFLFSFSGAKTIEKEYYYENGVLSHAGKYVYGLQSGLWKYYTDAGMLALEGEFVEGLETGVWNYYSEDGEILKFEHYRRGLEHGPFMSFHSPGVLMDSGVMENGRMNGLWLSRYENGQISQMGSFELDKPIGRWAYYHGNGQLEQEGFYVNGDKNGIWREWNDEGMLTEEAIYHSSGDIRWINIWGADGKQQIRDGVGHLVTYHDNGKISARGAIKDSIFDGMWKFFHENGQLAAEHLYNKGEKKVLNTFDPKGSPLVIKGNGIHQSYYSSGALMEEGSYKDGVQEGSWKIFYDNDNYTLMDQTDYVDGKEEGKSFKYNYYGQLEVSGEFQDGQRSGTWSWYNNDESLSSQVRYVNGKKEGEQVFYKESSDFLLKKELYNNGVYLETILH
ncbi:MAG TPA: toxin-antitoxin system YwqK family antitoxin [Anditalea sp.]|nr:toxin-antitoxin system YwqK family antitoxin [Anditalea sp.]